MIFVGYKYDWEDIDEIRLPLNNFKVRMDELSGKS